MTITLLFTVLGLSLVALLVFLLQRPEPQIYEEPVDSAGFDLNSQQLLERIFGEKDWDFLRSHVRSDVQRSFLRERREIAFAWLAFVRGRARAAMHHHLVNARNSRALEPALEFRLIINYLEFQLTCVLLAAILSLRSPVALFSMVRRANELALALRAITEFSGELRTTNAATRL